MWPSLGPWPDSNCSKTVEVRCSCQELKQCQREIATDEIQERKNYRECSNIKSACVRALTGQQRVSALSRIEPKSQDPLLLALAIGSHLAIGSCQSAEKNSIERVIHCCLQDCRYRIAQVEYQGQAHNTRILELKSLVYTSYCIQHRLDSLE